MIKYTQYDNMRRDFEITDKRILVKSSQDVEPNLKYAKALRDSENQTGRASEFKHVANVPNVIIEKILNEKGINIFKKEDQKAFYKEIETNYPHLKTTNMRLWT